MHQDRVSFREQMRFHARRLAVLAGLGVAVLTASAQALAQTDAWPTKPVRIIVPTAAGASTDFIARTFARYLEAKVGQPVVVENRPGAGAIIGAQAVKAAAPDGYTYLLGGTSTHSANPVLNRRLPYDPAKDFVEVGLFGVFPFVVLVRKDSQISSVAELVRRAKAEPGKLSFGYSSPSSQIPPSLVMARAGVQMVGANYKVITQILTDVAGGVVDFAVLDVLTAAPALQGGLLVPIAVTTPRRIPSLPAVATVAETLPGYEFEAWAGLSAPVGTPVSIVEQMNAHMRAALADNAVREALERQGLVIRPTTVAEHGSFVASDRARWLEWVQIARIPVQQ